MSELVLYVTIVVVSTCGLVYELVAGAVSTYLLGDSITQLSTIIGVHLSAMGVGAWLSKYVEDRIALRQEALARPETVPLLQCVMRAGQAVEPRPDLAAARQRHADALTHLAAPYLRLRGGAEYPVRLSPGLAALQQQVETALRQQGHEACRTPGRATHDRVER